jgi:hypothetical protein
VPGQIEHPSILNAVMAIPHGVAAFLAFRIARVVIPGTVVWPGVLAGLAVALGATGAAGPPVLGTTQSEMVPACFLLAGLFVLLRDAGPGAARWKAPAWAGLLFGIGAGLKLTVSGYALGGVAVLLVAPSCLWPRRVAAVAVFGGAAMVGLLVVAGPWWAVVYRAYENPVFPYFNDFFRSPFADAVAFIDERFKPRDWMQALFYPFYWAGTRQTLVSELPMRDPRFALAYVALVVMAARAPGRGGQLGVFFVVSFAVWEKQFFIFRYLAPLELLSGVVVTMAVPAVTRWRFAPHIVMATLLAGTVVWTVFPDWGRGPPGGPAVAVTVPALEADSLVVLLDGGPMAYVAAFAPASARFVGASNNLVRPGQQTGLARSVEAAIRDHGGPIWGLEMPDERAGEADVALRYHRLGRAEECSWIRSNLDGNAIRICRLHREAAG